MFNTIFQADCQFPPATLLLLVTKFLPKKVIFQNIEPENIYFFAKTWNWNIFESFKLQQESEMNGGPSMTLPSISEDDENMAEEGETSPLSPPNRSPLHTVTSPRHAKFRYH